MRAILRNLLGIALLLIVQSVLGGSLSVSDIKVNDESVPQAPGFKIQPVNGGAVQERALKLQDSLEFGVILQVPAHTVLTLKSINGNNSILWPGTRFTVHDISDKGESYGLEAGKASFDIIRALNFFKVDFKSYLAIVRGTRYTIEENPGKEIRFSVERGKVFVQREAKIKIAEDGKEGIFLASVILEAGGSVEYPLDTSGYFKEFKTYREAESYFKQRLAEDEKSGDYDRSMEGLNNMGNVLRMQGKNGEAIQYFRRTPEKEKYQKELNLEIIQLNKQGISFLELGGADNLKCAVESHEKALSLSLSLYPGGAHPTIAACYVNLGAAYSVVGGAPDLERAIGYHKKAQDMLLKLPPDGALPYLAASYGDLGLVYEKLGGAAHLEAAGRHYAEAARIAALFNDTGKTFAYTYQSGLAYAQSRPDSVHPEAKKQARALFDKLQATGDASNQVADTMDKWFRMAYLSGKLLFRLQPDQDCLAWLRTAAEMLDKLYRKKPEAASAKIAAGVYGNLAFNSLLNHQPDFSLKEARRGLELTPESAWIKAYEAHALLFLGQEDAALKIYRAHWQEKIDDGRTFGIAALDNFRLFRAAGLAAPAMDRVEAAMKADSSN